VEDAAKAGDLCRDGLSRAKAVSSGSGFLGPRTNRISPSLNPKRGSHETALEVLPLSPSSVVDLARVTGSARFQARHRTADGVYLVSGRPPRNTGTSGLRPAVSHGCITPLEGWRLSMTFLITFFARHAVLLSIVSGICFFRRYRAQHVLPGQMALR